MFRVIVSSTKRLTFISAVSVYLLVVGSFLILARRIRVSLSGFEFSLIALLRPPFKGDLKEFVPEKGNCYMASLEKNLISDSNGRSRLVLFENGQALLHPHSSHD